METNHVKLIDRYLNNDLTRAQQMEFEHKLEDLSFREKLMEQARLLDMQKEVFEDQIKNDIIQGAVLLENNNSTKNFFINHWKQLLAMLGLIVGALFIWQVFLVKKDEIPAEVLYADYFMHMPSDLVTRGYVDDSYEPAYREGLRLFSNGEYQNSIIEFDKQTRSNESSDLYKAISFGKLDQVQKSVDLLLPLLSSDTKHIRQNAEWYFIVNKVYKKELSAKDGLLQKLCSNEKHVFHEFAKRLQLEL